MRARDAVVMWTPDKPWIADESARGKVAVVARVDKRFSERRALGYSMWMPVAGTEHGITVVAMIFIHFHTLVVRDGIDVQAAHKAFLAIDEYHERISPDIEGAAA